MPEQKLGPGHQGPQPQFHLQPAQPQWRKHHRRHDGLDLPQLLFLRQYGPARGLLECAGRHDCVRRRRLPRPATKRRFVQQLVLRCLVDDLGSGAGRLGRRPLLGIWAAGRIY